MQSFPKMTAWPAASLPPLKPRALLARVPVTGQDGDHAALNRVALGTQLVSVWKDSRVLGKSAAEYANMIAEGKSAADIPGVIKFSGGQKGVEVNAVLIPPNPITKDKLNEVIDGGWVSQGKGLRWRSCRFGSCLRLTLARLDDLKHNGRAAPQGVARFPFIVKHCVKQSNGWGGRQCRQT